MLDRFVLHNARRYGDVVALGGLVRQCRFHQLEASVSRLARALQGLRDWSPRLVAVQCPDMWWHWMLVLALGRLGLASASLPGDNVSEEMLEVLSPELIIVHGGDILEGDGRLILSRAWFDSVLREAERDSSSEFFPPVSVPPNALCRVAVATGTDRDMHAFGLSFAEVEAALLRLVYHDAGEVLGMVAPQGPKPHLLCTISPVSISGFLMMGAALAAGTTVRGADHQNIGSEVAQAQSLFVVMTPVHLEHLLQALPPGMKPMTHIHLTVVGAPLSQKLLERTYAALTPHVHVAYGIDECGLICSVVASERSDELSVGRVLPWAGVEIVDGEDNPVPMGTRGVVRLRASGAAQEYLNDPEMTQKRFRHGWFYPGDRGFLSAVGELHLCGRVDELVAIGGGKFDLSEIDRLVKEEKAVSDAAAFVLWNREGKQVLYGAVVTEGELNGEVLSRRLRKRYPSLPVITIVWVGEIPYTDVGHVDRERLKRSLAVHLENQ